VAFIGMTDRRMSIARGPCEPHWLSSSQKVCCELDVIVNVTADCASDLLKTGNPANISSNEIKHKNDLLMDILNGALETTDI
jgi:hypothetical protein